MIKSIDPGRKSVPTHNRQLTTDTFTDFLNEGLLIILQSQMCNQFLTLHVTQGVFQFHELDEDIVFRVEFRSTHGALEVK